MPLSRTTRALKGMEKRLFCALMRLGLPGLGKLPTMWLGMLLAVMLRWLALHSMRTSLFMPGRLGLGTLLCTLQSTALVLTALSPPDWACTVCPLKTAVPAPMASISANMAASRVWIMCPLGVSCGPGQYLGDQ